MFERILLAVDGSEHSEKTIPVVTDMGTRYGAAVTVLHVREHEMNWGSDVDIETSEEASQLVERVVRTLKDAGVDVRGEIPRVTIGSASQEILRFAKETNADLIVMGTRGLTDWSGLLLGSVAHKVLHMADCPVLLVR
jgi:Universal stress protein UspA and related nucleotide-binding proteins